MVISAILITGGLRDAQRLTSAEIYNPGTKTSCSLPQLPAVRYDHSQEGGLTCGGGGIAERTTCVKWSPASGTWVQSHTLRQRRYGHVSWATDSGVYLIGGVDSLKTSEKVKVDGSVVESFSLKYYTR